MLKLLSIQSQDDLLVT